MGPQTGMDARRAGAIAQELFGVAARASELPSYADQNFLLQEVGGKRWVLKVAAIGTDADGLRSQNEAMELLAARGLPVPRPRASKRGETLVASGEPATDGTAPRWVRLVDYLPGDLLAEAEPDLALAEDLGRLMARVDAGLAELRHPVPGDGPWNLENALDSAPLAAAIPDAADLAIVTAGFDAFAERWRAALGELDRQPVHGDANDYNVLVSGDRHPPRVAGLLDFGDMTQAPRVCEVAIALAYLVLDKEDPRRWVTAFLAGYEGVAPLTDVERALLRPLIWTRLCVSVARSADARRRRPDDPYLAVTEPKAWRFLRRFGPAPEGLQLVTDR